MDSSIIIDERKVHEQRNKRICLMWGIKNFIQVKTGNCEHHIVVCLGEERDREWDNVICSHKKCLFCHSENVEPTDKTIIINAIDFKRGFYLPDIYGDCEKKMSEIIETYKNIKYYFLFDHIVRAGLLDVELKNVQQSYNREITQKWKLNESQKTLNKDK